MKRLSAFLLLLLFLLPLQALAQETPEEAESPLHYVGLEEEFHRYEFSDGTGFYTTLKKRGDRCGGGSLFL